MSQPANQSVIMADMVVEGDVIANGPITVNGRVQGNLSAQSVTISKSGGIFGSLRARNAEVHGAVQGDVSVLELIRIGETGSVSGQVEYGKISMDQGGELSATMRNVPPHMSGDLNLEVVRGGTVAITTVDLTAFDPDDAAKDLSFAVSKATNGHVAYAQDPPTAISTFTQADLEGGKVVFVHSGASAPTAGFNTSVSDAKGANSGEPRHVSVSVRA